MNTRLIIDGNAVYEIDEDWSRLPRTADRMQTLCGTGIPHPGTKHAFTENGTCQ